MEVSALFHEIQIATCERVSGDINIMEETCMRFTESVFIQSFFFLFFLTVLSPTPTPYSAFHSLFQIFPLT